MRRRGRPGAVPVLRQRVVLQRLLLRTKRREQAERVLVLLAHALLPRHRAFCRVNNLARAGKPNHGDDPRLINASSMSSSSSKSGTDATGLAVPVLLFGAAAAAAVVAGLFSFAAAAERLPLILTLLLLAAGRTIEAPLRLPFAFGSSTAARTGGSSSSPTTLPLTEAMLDAALLLRALRLHDAIPLPNELLRHCRVLRRVLVLQQDLVRREEGERWGRRRLRGGPRTGSTEVPHRSRPRTTAPQGSCSTARGTPARGMRRRPLCAGIDRESRACPGSAPGRLAGAARRGSAPHIDHMNETEGLRTPVWCASTKTRFVTLVEGGWPVFCGVRKHKVRVARSNDKRGGECGDGTHTLIEDVRGRRRRALRLVLE